MESRENLELEWKMLICEAKSIGLTVEEVRDFLRGEKKSAPFFNPKPMPAEIEAGKLKTK